MFIVVVFNIYDVMQFSITVYVNTFIYLYIISMRMKRRMRETLCFRVDEYTWEVVNQLAEKNERAVAEVARDLISAGLMAKGIEC